MRGSTEEINPNFNSSPMQYNTVLLNKLTPRITLGSFKYQFPRMHHELDSK